MALAITINQSGKPAGVSGRAREDLDTALPVTLTADGGPYAAYRWTIISKPDDVVASVKSSASLTAALQQTTQVSPIDLPGTYLVEVAVDSGNGIGAGEGDVARITFYAGPALASDPRIPLRRKPAFGERDEHNVADALDATGNPKGWAREMDRWLEGAARSFAWVSARIKYNAGIVDYEIARSFNVQSITKLGPGGCRVTFAFPMPDANYTAHVTPMPEPPTMFAFPYAIDATANYIDVRFVDETAVEVSSGFALRIELGVDP